MAAWRIVSRWLEWYGCGAVRAGGDVDVDVDGGVDANTDRRVDGLDPG